MHCRVSGRSAESMNRAAVEEVEEVEGRVGAGGPAEQVSCCHLTQRGRKEKKRQTSSVQSADSQQSQWE